jgi:hypothetical protein
VKAVCREQTEQMGTWGNCLQVCFILNCACFEEGSFLMWGCNKMAIFTFIQMRDFFWFFYPDVPGGENFVTVDVLSKFHRNIALTNNVQF